MTTREEVAMLTEHLDATEELAAAKEAYRSALTDENRARLAAAKRTVIEQRQFWREIRAFFRPTVEDGDGVAQPETVKASATAGKVK